MEGIIWGWAQNRRFPGQTPPAAGLGLFWWYISAVFDHFGLERRVPNDAYDARMLALMLTMLAL